MKTYSVDLTYEELILLDGKVSDEAQEVITTAKVENEFGLDDISNEILRKALKDGELRWGCINISRCTCCNDKPGGYYKYTRSSRYHHKGDNNYDRPIRYRGVIINTGFVVVDGLPGICYECWRKTYLPKIVNYIVENNLPIHTHDNDIAKTRWIKDTIRECTKCGKKAPTSKWGKSATLFGNGLYPSTCPHCEAFNSSVITKEFNMVEVEE